jgi:hypothetical protein
MAKLKTGVKSANMTEEQAQLAKMQSWDRYQKSKAKLAAHESQIHTWEEKYSALAQRLRTLNVDLIEQDQAWLPSPNVFAKAMEDYRTARIEHDRARVEAQRNGFPTE